MALAKFHWCDGSGRLELVMTLEQAQFGSHQGECFDDIESLLENPEIKDQIDKMDPEVLAQAVEEYGFEDPETNDRHRILFIACGDIVDDPAEHIIITNG